MPEEIELQEDVGLLKLEVEGLKLQIASKQEIVERCVEELDGLKEEVRTKTEALRCQEKEIETLRRSVEEWKSKENEMKMAYDALEMSIETQQRGIGHEVSNETESGSGLGSAQAQQWKTKGQDHADKHQDDETAKEILHEKSTYPRHTWKTTAYSPAMSGRSTDAARSCLAPSCKITMAARATTHTS